MIIVKVWGFSIRFKIGLVWGYFFLVIKIGGHQIYCEHRIPTRYYVCLKTLLDTFTKAPSNTKAGTYCPHNE